MFVTKAALLFTSCLIFQKSVLAGCPYSQTSDGEIPNDCAHKGVRGRRLASLAHDEVTKKNIESFFKSREGRSLQADNCLTTSVMEDLKSDLEELSQAITNDGDRGHFLGGIVRLAAHDFMDYDMNVPDELGGSDGCLDLAAPPNAGLSDVWCNDQNLCPYKGLFDETYSQYMSMADFWVAGATMVVEFSSVVDAPILFRYGRPDSNNCPSSSSRLPADDGCTAVEGVFIDRMGLSWTDAVALMGAHTLGRGSINFSGHQGTWVDNAQESTIFDKRYYRELVDRGWIPRETDAGTDWTWGNADRNTMMLNSDICLAFDIPDGDDQNCCTNINQRSCRNFDIQCPAAATVRPEAYQAVLMFKDEDEDEFYNAFSEAWVKATENGIDNLQEVPDTCGTPTTSTPPTPAPSPTSSPPCSDIEGNWENNKGREVDCAWVISNNKCAKYGAAWCPVSCDMCPESCEDVPSFEDGRGRTRDCTWVISKDKCSRYQDKCVKSCGLC